MHWHMRAGLAATVVEAPDVLHSRLVDGTIAIPKTHFDACINPNPSPTCSGYVTQSLNSNNIFEVNPTNSQTNTASHSTRLSTSQDSRIQSTYGIALDRQFETTLFITDFVGNQVYKLTMSLGIMAPSTYKGTHLKPFLHCNCISLSRW